MDSPLNFKMNSKVINLKCVNCSSEINNFINDWLYKCKSCQLESSLLFDDEINGKSPIGWTESANDFLEKLRIYNAKCIIKELSKYTKIKSKSLLDIGCAAGWFLGVAKEHQMEALGVEPEKNIAAKGIKKGLDIKTVTFPDISLKNKKFNVITFNDVFEHIKKPGELLNQIYDQLEEEGYLIINLPSSDGVFYKISCLLAKAGYTSPLERLWQKGYFSPHLYYYSNRNLKAFVEQHGFKLISKNRLDVIQIDGLWNRVMHNGAMGKSVSLFVYCSIVISYPLLKYVFPSDIMFHIYKKS